ncbi:ATP-binding protein [bacterium]|nr:ATP-binding protein [bacterium]
MLVLSRLPSPPRFIGLEEADRGLHPLLLRRVYDAINRLCHPEEFGEKRKPVQVVATTHSPYFLDLFNEHPEEVWIAEKVNSDAKFRKLNEMDNFEEILSGSSLGSVWYSGILGGVPTE